MSYLYCCYTACHSDHCHSTPLLKVWWWWADAHTSKMVLKCVTSTSFIAVYNLCYNVAYTETSLHHVIWSPVNVGWFASLLFSDIISYSSGFSSQHSTTVWFSAYASHNKALLHACPTIRITIKSVWHSTSKVCLIAVMKCMSSKINPYTGFQKLNKLVW